jgi:hypothetical protein
MPNLNGIVRDVLWRPSGVFIAQSPVFILKFCIELEASLPSKYLL